MVSWIFGRRDEIAKIWDFRGPFAAAKDPLAAARLRRRIFHPRVHRGEATVHSMEMLCFVFSVSIALSTRLLD